MRDVVLKSSGGELVMVEAEEVVMTLGEDNDKEQVVDMYKARKNEAKMIKENKDQEN